jgi:hypothetical protein
MQADGLDNSGGLFFAIKPVRSATVLRNCQGNTRVCLSGLKILCDLRLRSLQRWVLDFGVVLAENGPDRTLEKLICDPPNASEPLAQSASVDLSISWVHVRGRRGRQLRAVADGQARAAWKSRSTFNPP